jgi:hypothetical protein
MDDHRTLRQSEVLAAFRLLFSPETEFNLRSIDSVQHAQLKTAYRKKALRTHPDRYASEGEEVQRIYSERFIQVSQAYDTLSHYLTLREQGWRWKPVASDQVERAERKPQPAQRQTCAASKTCQSKRPEREGPGSLWQRGIPRRYLRFAEFLYFSRVISWRNLVNAIVWQRRQRPRIGEIAQKWRWISGSQIEAAVKDRRVGERIGEVLLRHKLLTPFGLGVLLRQQQRIQKPIGLYFVRHGLMSEWEVGRHLHKQRMHNMEFASPFSAGSFA